MRKVRIWQTLAGVLILTEDSISFGYYPPNDIPKLQNDLEHGMSENHVAGFSGSVYPLDKIRRIYLKVRQSKILVEYREFLMKDMEDLTFRTKNGFQDFCRTAPEFLGPAWNLEKIPCGNIFGILIPLAITLSMAIMIFAGIWAVINDPGPKSGEENKRNLAATLNNLVVFELPLVGAVYWLVRRIKNPPRIDCFQKS